MAESGQDHSSSGLTPLDQLPPEVQDYIRQQNEAARADRARREAREERRPPGVDDALRRARETGEKFGDPRPGRPSRMQPPHTS